MIKTPTFVDAHVATKGLRFKSLTAVGLTVHCSATRPSQDWGATEIDRMHRQQGWLAIGYHYVIRRDGTIELGRPRTAQGSHCKNGSRNQTNLGVCLVGGVSEKPLKHVPGSPWNGSDAECNFTAAQMASLKALIAYLQVPAGKIEGHRDVPGVTKACPSFQVQHWLKTGEVKL